MASGSIGDLVNVDGCYGVIRYVGELEGDPGKNIWYGVEWELANRGKNDGSLRGKRYFECPANQGSFLKSQIVRVEKEFLKAVHDRYIAPFVPDHDFMITDPRTRKQKKMEFVGASEASQFFEKVFQLDFLTLTDSSIASFTQLPDKPFLAKKILLDNNNLNSWDTVFSILQYLPHCHSLSLKDNLLPHSSSDISSPPQFPNIKTLSLSGTKIPLLSALNICLRHFPNVEELSLAYNDIEAGEELSLSLLPQWIEERGGKETVLPSLSSLDLEGNSVLNWSFLSTLSFFRNLNSLMLNRTKRPSPLISNSLPETAGDETSGEERRGEESERGEILSLSEHQKLNLSQLQEILLEGTPIHSWHTWGELSHTIPSLKSLRTTGCPSTERLGRTGRQLLLATFPQLKLLNAAEVPPREKTHAELYFLSVLRSVDSQKRALKELCEACDCEGRVGERLLKVHEEIMGGEKRGEERRGEEREEGEKPVVLVLDAQQCTGAAVVRRKFFPSTMIGDVKNAIEKAFNVKRGDCQLFLREVDNPALMEMNDDKKDIAYYGVVSGSTVVVMDKNQMQKEEQDYQRRRMRQEVHQEI